MAVSTGPADKMTIGVYKMIHDVVLADKLSDDMYAAVKEGQKAHGIIAYMNGDVAVGEIGAEVKGGIATVKSLAVLEAYRKLGVATELVKALETLPKIKSIEFPVPKSNEIVVVLLKKLEWTEKSQTDDSIIFAKAIAKK